jgi:hypothetical protein
VLQWKLKIIDTNENNDEELRISTLKLKGNIADIWEPADLVISSKIPNIFQSDQQEMGFNN